MNEKIASTLKVFFSERPGIRLAYVFGSVARSREGPDSDIDIAVLSETPLEVDERLSLVQDLENLTDRTVDLVDLSRFKGLIFHRAVTGGYRVKGSGSDHAKALMRALVWSADYLPLLRRTRDAKIKRFIDGS